MIKANLTVVTLEDIPTLCALMNLCYRSNQGWTNEFGMVTGERIQAADLLAYSQRPDVHFFRLVQNAKIVACCAVIEHKSATDHYSEFGSFAVHPSLQGQGLGKQLLAWGEEYAKNILGSSKMIMQVLRPRNDLIAYYQRRGYQLTDEQSPFPTDANVGTPTDPNLMLCQMKKRL